MNRAALEILLCILVSRNVALSWIQSPIYTIIHTISRLRGNFLRRSIEILSNIWWSFFAKIVNGFYHLTFYHLVKFWTCNIRNRLYLSTIQIDHQTWATNLKDLKAFIVKYWEDCFRDSSYSVTSESLSKLLAAQHQKWDIANIQDTWHH